MSCSQSPVQVAKVIPLKQGLKLKFEYLLKSFLLIVAKVIPPKQGLKLIVNNPVIVFTINFAKVIPLKQGLKPFKL